MTGFPNLEPAMTILVEIDAGIDVGSASKGTPLVVVPMTGGTIKSEPDFSPSLDAEFHGTGHDYIRYDPGGEHMRLDAHSVIKDKSGALIYLNYTGVVTMTEEVAMVFTGHPNAKTTSFGDAFIELRFETGDEKFKELEHTTFVGSGRFRLDPGKSIVVEYKLSKVVKG